MKRFPFALSAACIALVLTVPAAQAGSFAAVNQSGNYKLTIVEQKGGHTKVMTRQIRPRMHASTANRMAVKAVQASNKQSVFGDVIRITCGGGNGGNDVSVDQYGVGNSATAAQSGANNTVVATQTGTNNATHVVQQGSNHTAYTTQTGSNNIAFVNQRC
ncbi:MAG: curlin repeat-containing protein [Parvibaculum sp.]|nr:curlin repeat-containing protein [Parvibaculum sp.]